MSIQKLESRAGHAGEVGAFGYQPNRAVLHRDPRLMPRRRRAWASWNYLGHTDGSGAEQLLFKGAVPWTLTPPIYSHSGDPMDLRKPR